MRILFRDCNGNYVWRNMVENKNTIKRRLEDGAFKIVDDEGNEAGTAYSNEVIKIEDDFTNKYVICEYCGEPIINTPENIEKHFDEEEAKANCFECRYMTERNVQILNETKYNKVSDNGQYEKTTTKRVTLVCNSGYMTDTIDDAKENGNCYHYKCRLRGTNTGVKTLIDSCPNFYDKLITERTLVEAGWRLICRRNNGKDRQYYSPESKIYAICDQYGIVKEFCVTYRKNDFYFRYSPEYGCTFDVNGYSRINTFSNAIGCAPVTEKKFLKELATLNV